LGIVKCNPNGKFKLIDVSNPYSKPCAEAHLVRGDLLNNNPDEWLMAPCSKGEEPEIKQTLHNGFLSPKRTIMILLKNF